MTLLDAIAYVTCGVVVGVVFAIGTLALLGLLAAPFVILTEALDYPWHEWAVIRRWIAVSVVCIVVLIVVVWLDGNPGWMWFP